VDYTQRAGVQEKGERAFEWCGGWFGWAVQYLAPKLLALTGFGGQTRDGGGKDSRHTEEGGSSRGNAMRV